MCHEENAPNDIIEFVKRQIERKRRNKDERLWGKANILFPFARKPARTAPWNGPQRDAGLDYFSGSGVIAKRSFTGGSRGEGEGRESYGANKSEEDETLLIRWYGRPDSNYFPPWRSLAARRKGIPGIEDLGNAIISGIKLRRVVSLPSASKASRVSYPSHPNPLFRHFSLATPFPFIAQKQSKYSSAKHNGNDSKPNRAE